MKVSYVTLSQLPLDVGIYVGGQLKRIVNTRMAEDRGWYQGLLQGLRCGNEVEVESILLNTTEEIFRGQLHEMLALGTVVKP
jgi:hypothetical protein